MEYVVNESLVANLPYDTLQARSRTFFYSFCFLIVRHFTTADFVSSPFVFQGIPNTKVD